MFDDETPRLFSVADILRKRKNKDDDYEFDDFADTKEQHMVGKYDSNFDALGSEFERAHNYDFNNVKQPENTKTDIDFSDYYDRLLKYEPSSYIKLEEDEIIPFSIDNDKPNEYYIDDLKGKTLDDLVISKMKENAGAENLPRDAMRRKFADDLLNQELPSFSYLATTPEEELQEQRKQHKKTALKNLNAKHQNGPIVIEAPLSSGIKTSRNVQPPPKRASSRIQGISASPVPISPERESKQKNKKEKASSSSAYLMEEEINASPSIEAKQANTPVLKRGLQKFKENVARNNPTYEEMEKDGVAEKTMNNLKLKQALSGLKKNIDSNKAERESIISPEKTVATVQAPYMKEDEIPSKRGRNPNTATGLEKNVQNKLEKKFPYVVTYKDSYSKLPKDQIVSRDVIKQFNKDVSPQTHIKLTVPITVEDFLKFIQVEFDRRMPKDQQPKLTAEALAHHTPKAKKTKGSNTPIGEVIGMMGGLG